MPILTVFIAFLVTWIATGVLVGVLVRRNIVDLPNSRSSHRYPTPRGGGIGIVTGIGVAIGMAAWLDLGGISVPILAGVALVAISGAIDDVRGGTPALARMLIQTGAAWLVVSNCGGLARFPLPAPLDADLGGWGSALAVLWIVAGCNFFNFLDGIDGYAATQAVLAGIGFLLLGREELSTMALALIGACLGFMIYNWHPAKIFMGDSGSVAIGFLLAALPFALPAGPRETSVFATGLFLWFFLSDGLFTLLMRLSRGEKIWTPHRTHLYQRLVVAGMRHDAVVMRVGCAAAPLVILAAASFRSQAAVLQWMSLLAGVVCFAVYFRWTRLVEARVSGAEGNAQTA